MKPVERPVAALTVVQVCETVRRVYTHVWQGRWSDDPIRWKYGSDINTRWETSSSCCCCCCTIHQVLSV